MPNTFFIFAPLEGITDPIFRQTILELYPEWDYFFTDFWRVPRSKKISRKSLLAHLGENIHANANWRDKHVFQILACQNANLEAAAQSIADLGIKWLDLNIGCPSKVVVRHHGGAYLLQHPEILQKIIVRLRASFPHTLSVKMRLGENDGENFASNLHLLQELGVDRITVHARTRNQYYTGKADWGHFLAAKKLLSIPLIVNGDIGNKEDIKKIEAMAVWGMMIGRGALATPWLPRATDARRIDEMPRYYLRFQENLLLAGLDKKVVLQRLKSITRYCFNEIDPTLELRQKLLRGHTLEEFILYLKPLIQE